MGDTEQEVKKIRTDKITRKEGVSLVRKYDGEFPKKYFKDFLNYIDIDEKLFWQKRRHYCNKKWNIRF